MKIPESGKSEESSLSLVGRVLGKLVMSSEKHVAHDNQVIYCSQNVSKVLVDIWTNVSKEAHCFVCILPLSASCSGSGIDKS